MGRLESDEGFLSVNPRALSMLLEYVQTYNLPEASIHLNKYLYQVPLPFLPSIGQRQR